MAWLDMIKQSSMLRSQCLQFHPHYLHRFYGLKHFVVMTAIGWNLYIEYTCGIFTLQFMLCNRGVDTMEEIAVLGRTFLVSWLCWFVLLKMNFGRTSDTSLEKFSFECFLQNVADVYLGSDSSAYFPVHIFDLSYFSNLVYIYSLQFFSYLIKLLSTHSFC